MGFKERDVKRKTSAIQDKVVAAVLSRASNVKRLVTDFTQELATLRIRSWREGQSSRKSLQGFSFRART